MAGAFFIFSATLLAFTVVLAVIIYLMLRGQNFVNITAEGAGRDIHSEDTSHKQLRLKEEINASISYSYPLYNIAGRSSF